MAIPKPHSELPWYAGESRPTRPYTVAEFRHDPLGRHKIVRGNPTGGGPFFAAMETEQHQQDRDYALWAANNAQKMYGWMEKFVNSVPDGEWDEDFEITCDLAWGFIVEARRILREANDGA